MDAELTERTAESAVRGDVALDSAALKRLVEEVRNGAVGAPSAYNRMHNRHNR